MLRQRRMAKPYSNDLGPGHARLRISGRTDAPGQCVKRALVALVSMPKSQLWPNGLAAAPDPAQTAFGKDTSRRPVELERRPRSAQTKASFRTRQANFCRQVDASGKKPSERGE